MDQPKDPPRKISPFEKKRWLLDNHYTSFSRANMKIATQAIREKERNRKRKGADVSFTDPAADWQIIYGKQRVGGVITYAQTANKKKFLLLVVTIACHKIDHVSKLFLDGTEIPFADPSLPSGESVNPWVGSAGNPIVEMYVNDGSEHQSAISQLITDSGGAWTSDHRQRGCAHVYLKLRYSKLFFPNGVPEIEFEVYGKKMLETDTWSNNPIAILKDFFLDSRYGLGRHLGNSLLVDSFTPDDVGEDEAFCDDLVPQASGPDIPRYTCDVTFHIGETASSMIDQILSSFAGQLIVYDSYEYPSVVLAPRHRATSMSFAQKDFLSEFEYVSTEPISEAVASIAGTFVDAEAGYKENDFPAFNLYSDSQYNWISRDSIQLPATVYRATAQRLAKIHLLRRFYDGRIQFTAGLNAYKLAPGDVISISDDDFFTDELFEVEAVQLIFASGLNGGLVLGTRIEARQTSSTIYDFDVSEEVSGTAAETPDFPNNNVNSDTNPTNLVLTSGASIAFIQPDGTVVGRIKATWTSPEDSFVTEDGTIEIQAKLSLDSTWGNTIIKNGNDTEAFIDPVKIGQYYDVRIRGVTFIGVPGDWIAVTNHLVVGIDDKPSDVANFLYTVVGGNVSLTWNPVPEPNIAFYRIKKTTTAQPWESCTLVTEQLGQPVIADNTGTPTFKIKAVNTFGYESENATDAVLYSAPGTGSPVGLLLGLTQA